MTRKKRMIARLMACMMLVGLLAGCGNSATDTNADAQTDTEPQATPTDADTTTDEEPVTLIVFAAASMTETLNQIKELYEQQNPNVTISYNFDSSGKLKTQI